MNVGHKIEKYPCTSFLKMCCYEVNSWKVVINLDKMGSKMNLFSNIMSKNLAILIFYQVILL